MARRAAALPVALAAALAATGWLYAFRPGLVGPRLGEALPLDELSRHSASSLVWFVLVWGAAAGLVGGYARWSRVDRTSGALLLGLTVGLWSYLQSGVSIAVVRQTSLRTALDTAARVHAVYLTAALVGLAVAALARPRRTGGGSPLVVAWVIGTAALLDMLHLLLPGDDTGVLRSLTPDALGPLARAAGVLAATSLLFAARGLARRRRRAWQVALAVDVASTALHLLRGFDHGTVASLVVLVVLVARRQDFDRPGDAESRHLVARRLVAVLGTIAVYAFATLWLNRVAADQTFTLGFATRETASGLLGLHVRGSPHFAGAFADWFPLSLFLLGVAGSAWIVAGWLAPWRHRVVQAERERELARSLVQAWGVDTLAPFVLRSDKSYFFDERERAFLAYRVVGGVAIVSGDPIGPRDALDELVASFVAHAHRRDWRVAILGASEAWLPLYRRRGLHALYHGDEAVVETSTFTLDGRPIRKVRQSVHRLTNAGYQARVLRPSELDSGLRARLEHVSRDWRGTAPERGFVMALDTLFTLGDEEALFVVGFSADGDAAGFLHFALSRASTAISLSSMPRLRSTPNGFNEWLIVETIGWARDHGISTVSLNFAPFAALLAPEIELTGLQELQRRALLSLKGHFQLDNLLAFNRKFFPQWQRRFVVYERRRDLPRVGIAALAAEAYLPFQRTRR